MKILLQQSLLAEMCVCSYTNLKVDSSKLLFIDSVQGYCTHIACVRDI